MARVQYTSAIDLIVRVALALCLLALCFALAQAFTPLVAASFETLSERDASAGALGIAAAAIFFTIAVLPGDTDEHIGTITSWLYARMSLGVPLSWLEAKAVADLFAYSGHETWYPLKEIKHLSPHLRKRAIFEIAKKTQRVRNPLARARHLKWKKVAVCIGLLVWIAFVASAASGYGYLDVRLLAGWGLLPAAIYGATYFLLVAKTKSSTT